MTVTVSGISESLYMQEAAVALDHRSVSFVAQDLHTSTIAAIRRTFISQSGIKTQFVPRRNQWIRVFVQPLLQYCTHSVDTVPGQIHMFTFFGKQISKVHTLFVL